MAGKKNKTKQNRRQETWPLIGAVCSCKRKPTEIASSGADNVLLACLGSQGSSERATSTEQA